MSFLDAIEKQLFFAIAYIGSYCVIGILFYGSSSFYEKGVSEIQNYWLLAFLYFAISVLARKYFIKDDGSNDWKWPSN
jgi:hypothetical protein